MTEENKGIEGVFGDGSGDTEQNNGVQQASSGSTEPKKPAAKKPAAKKKEEVKKVRIKLAHNKDIPPSGLHIGHNGRGYLLKPGHEVDVPEFLLDVLDNAVATRPTTDQSGRVQGYEEQPRFMYTIIRNKK